MFKEAKFKVTDNNKVIGYLVGEVEYGTLCRGDLSFVTKEQILDYVIHRDMLNIYVDNGIHKCVVAGLNDLYNSISPNLVLPDNKITVSLDEYLDDLLSVPLEYLNYANKGKAYLFVLTGLIDPDYMSDMEMSLVVFGNVKLLESKLKYMANKGLLSYHSAIDKYYKRVGYIRLTIKEYKMLAEENRMLIDVSLLKHRYTDYDTKIFGDVLYKLLDYNKRWLTVLR